MSQIKDLIKDTVAFLQTLDDKFTESNTVFFQKNLEKQKKKKLLSLEKPKVQKKLLPDSAHSVKTTPVNSIKKEEKKASTLQDEIPPKKEFKNFNIETAKPLDTHPSKEVLKTNNLKKPTFKIVETKKIKLEEKPPLHEENFSDIKQLLPKVFPNLKILNTVLDDKIGRQKSAKYKLKNIAANITILAYRENEKFYRFLEKLAIATNNYFYPSKVISAYLIEKENNWDMFLSDNEIFLIIASDYTIFELPNLRKFYKENPAKSEKFVKDIPLFLLPDISIYIKEPTLKSSLFKALKQKINTLKK